MTKLEKFMRNIEIAANCGCAVPKLMVNHEPTENAELKVGGSSLIFTLPPHTCIAPKNLSAFDAAIWAIGFKAAKDSGALVEIAILDGWHPDVVNNVRPVIG